MTDTTNNVVRTYEVDTSAMKQSAADIGAILGADETLVAAFDRLTTAKEDVDQGPVEIMLDLATLDNDGVIDLAAFPEPGLDAAKMLPGDNRIPDKYKRPKSDGSTGSESASWYQDTFLAMSPRYAALAKRIAGLSLASRDIAKADKEYASMSATDIVADLAAARGRLNYGVENLFRKAVRLHRHMQAIMDQCDGVSVTVLMDNGKVRRGKKVILFSRAGEPSEAKSIGETLAMVPEIAAQNGGTISALKVSGSKATPTDAGQNEPVIKNFASFEERIADLAIYFENRESDAENLTKFRAALTKKCANDPAFLRSIGRVYLFLDDEVWPNIEQRYRKADRDEAAVSEMIAAAVAD